MRAYVLSVLIAFDTFWNAVFRGKPGETISGRAATARLDNRWWGCVMCKFLDWLETNHCNVAMHNDAIRALQVTRDFDR